MKQVVAFIIIITNVLVYYIFLLCIITSYFYFVLLQRIITTYDYYRYDTVHSIITTYYYYDTVVRVQRILVRNVYLYILLILLAVLLLVSSWLAFKHGQRTQGSTNHTRIQSIFPFELEYPGAQGKMYTLREICIKSWRNNEYFIVLVLMLIDIDFMNIDGLINYA